MTVKKSFFTAINRVGGLMPHSTRRFVLDRLGLNAVFSAMARDQFAVVMLPGGQRLTYNPLLHGGLVRGGELVYEQHVIDGIRETLVSGGVFYDIGANIGVFSLLAVEAVGQNGFVFAFEPEENNFNCLRRSITANGTTNVRVIDVAIGVADGLSVFDRRGGAFSGRIVAPGDTSAGATMEIEVRTIDSLVEEGLPAPTLIKIDVEGAEGDVLEGATKTLRKHRPVVICELHDFGSDGPKRALRALNDADYSLKISKPELHSMNRCRTMFSGDRDKHDWLDAMRTKMVLHAARDGTIERVLAAAGTQVGAKSLLVVFGG